MVHGPVEFPAFYSGYSGIKSPQQVYEPSSAASCWIAHRDLLQQNSGFVIAVPPKDLKDSDIILKSIDIALSEAKEKNIHGKEVTPFLLGRINELSAGSSLRANISLVQNNVRVAAQIASCLAQRRKSRNRGHMVS